jgi:hypothetical protein
MNFLGLSALQRTSNRLKQLSIRRECLSVVLQLAWNEKRLCVSKDNEFLNPANSLKHPVDNSFSIILQNDNKKEVP